MVQASSIIRFMSGYDWMEMGIEMGIAMDSEMYLDDLLTQLIDTEFLSTDIYILMHVWQTPVRGGWTVRLRVHVLSVCLDKRIDESVNKTKA